MLRIVVTAGLVLLLSSSALAVQPVHLSRANTAHHKRISKRHHKRKAKAAPVQTRVDVYNGSKAQTQVFNEEPVSRTRKNGRPAPAMTRVDVINGSEKQMQVFRPEPIPVAPAAKPAGKSRSQRNVAEANVSDVEIFNGTTKQRRIFKGDGAASGQVPTQSNRVPVVVGIAATGAEPAERNAQRVVTGIESGKPVAADPVAVGVSPSPARRPAYVPAPEQ